MTSSTKAPKVTAAVAAAPALDWTSPAKAAAFLTTLDTKDPDFDYALMLPKRDGPPRAAADLLRGKLQPRQPNPQEWAHAQGWPVTARDHRLVLARHVPMAPSIEALVADYDAQVVPHQTVLAMVLTVHYDEMAMYPHDAMAMVATFCETTLAKWGVTSVLVQHTPGQMFADRRPHMHIVSLARIAAGLSQEDFAAQANIDRATHGKLERGAINASLHDRSDCSGTRN